MTENPIEHGPIGVKDRYGAKNPRIAFPFHQLTIQSFDSDVNARWDVALELTHGVCEMRSDVTCLSLDRAWRIARPESAASERNLGPVDGRTELDIADRSHAANDRG